MPYPKIRLYVEQGLHEGALLRLEGKAHHYLVHVMRVKPGERIGLFNGRDGEWIGVAQDVGKKEIFLQLTQQIKEQKSSPDLWLMFVPIKQGPQDFLVQKASELGVSRLMPVKTRFGQIPRVNLERMRDTAIEAAEQCERLDVPACDDLIALEKALANWPKDRILIMGDESGNGAPILPMLEGLGEGLYGILIGPEGGFAPDEHALLKELPFVRAASLGPRVMRAETAAIAAITCVMAHKGDWHERPHFTG